MSLVELATMQSRVSSRADEALRAALAMARPGRVRAVFAAALLLAGTVCAPAADADARQELEELKKRNATLEELVRQQQAVIETLNRRVTAIEQAGAKRPEEDEPVVQVPARTKFHANLVEGDVPAGTHQLEAWDERLPAEVKPVPVPESGTVTVDFVLSVKNLPKI